jgi:hypothetical protein
LLSLFPALPATLVIDEWDLLDVAESAALSFAPSAFLVAYSKEAKIAKAVSIAAGPY